MTRITTGEFLSHLRSLDIKLWQSEGRLRYSAPAGVLTPALKAELIDRKEEILKFLGEAEAAVQVDSAPIQPVMRTENMPLSFAQQRLWFLDRLDPGSPVYNIPVALWLVGPLDVGALEQSLSEIVRRHEILRTTFTIVAGQPSQVIRPTSDFRLEILGVSSGQNPGQADDPALILNALVKEAQQPFDLAHGPLLRAVLWHVAAEEHILLLLMHHIISDGWSLQLFFRELSSLYQAYTLGQPSPLPEPPLQYTDFAVWQRAWLQGRVLETQLAYWKKQLGGKLPVLQLPTDRPHPPIQTSHGATYTFVLPNSLTEALKTLSRQAGVTLYMTLLAAFKALLYRYTGQTDILVGSPTANRQQQDIEGLIGFFVNTLVLRTDLSGNPTFRELLGQVREVALAAYAHQDLPFEQLVEVLHPERDLSRPPLFQVMFVLQGAPLANLDLPGLTPTLIEIDNATAKFDLTMSLTENGPELSGALEYNTDLFDPATIVRLAGHFQTLLAGISANPDQPLWALPLLTEAEKCQLLVEWNAARMDYPDLSRLTPGEMEERESLVQWFEVQVERTPEAVAAVFEAEQLTYRELNRRANQLGHYLQALGVGPEVLVGVYVERSLEMLVGLLAVLKAGGAYVPLDPAFPPERLAYMVEDAQISILLSQQRLREGLASYQGSTPAGHPTRVVYLDADWERIAQEDEKNPASRVVAENLAYVIYTSGSTGQPKGVQISRRALTNFLNSMRQEPGLTGQDKLLAVTTLSFDIAGLELFLPLIVGAQVILVSREVAADGNQLAEQLAATGATAVQATPATWRMLLEAGWSGAQRLKVLCGGEALPRDLANRLLERVGCLWNMYGPTETTIWSTLDRVEAGAGPVSIGRPIANTEVYILDGHLQPVPIGVSGELYLGGEGLARGYFDRAELTASKFIPHPFSREPGARLYKTGDLARYLADGRIEFFGRIDHQVKVRGFRIELGEIETLLGQHPALRQAVVVAREDQTGAKHLVAYLVPTQFPPPPASELRHYLAQKLPDYMIPARFVPLEAFPLTPNGKIDRQALPALDQERPDLKEAYVAPRDLLELQLAQIWEELMDIRPIGVKDNFLELGGHSLLAVRLMTQIQQRFGQEVPLAALFQEGTVAHLAALLRRQTDFRSQSPLIAIQPSGIRLPFFCVHPADGTVFSYVQLARYLGQDQPFYGLQVVSQSDEQPPQPRLETMAADYLQAIQTIQPQGPYLLGGWSMGGVVAFEIAQQLHRQRQPVALLALLDSWAPSSGKPIDAAAEPEADRQLLAQFLGDLRGRFAKDLPALPDDLAQLDSTEQLNYILEQARLLEFLFPTEGLPQLGRLFQTFKANVRAMWGYRPQVYPDRITLFQASESAFTAGTGTIQPPDPASSWPRFSTEPVEMYLVPGDHYTMLAEPHVQTLAERLRTNLDQAQAVLKETYHESR